MHAKFKQTFFLSLEWASYVLIGLGLIKIIDDIYLLSGLSINEFKNPYGFEAWPFDPSPIGLLRDAVLTFLLFSLRRRLVSKRQRAAREKLGL